MSSKVTATVGETQLELRWIRGGRKAIKSNTGYVSGPKERLELMIASMDPRQDRKAAADELARLAGNE